MYWPSYEAYTGLRDAANKETSVLDTIEQEIASDVEEKTFVTSMSSGEREDIIQLDVVSGETICVLRSTLRQCQDVVLYCQFDATA